MTSRDQAPSATSPTSEAESAPESAPDAALHAAGPRGTHGSAAGGAQLGRDDVRTDHPAQAPLAAGEPQATVRMRVRRAPRFGRFIVAGFVVGFVLGVLFDLYWPAIAGIEAESPYMPLSETAFFASLFGLTGALVAAIVAVILDRRS